MISVGEALCVFFISCFGVCIFLLFSLFHIGAPYEASRDISRRSIVRFSKGSRKIAELGCGKGDVLFDLVRAGYEVVGFEINPFFVYRLRKKIKKMGVSDKAKVVWGNFFNQDLGAFDTVVLFQFKTVMNKIKRKLLRELPSGAKIISNHWKFKGLVFEKERDSVYLYRV